jgi:hypothetical protein
VVVEFSVENDRYPFVGASASESCAFELEEMIHRGGGVYSEFFPVRGADTDRILSLAAVSRCRWRRTARIRRSSAATTATELSSRSYHGTRPALSSGTSSRKTKPSRSAQNVPPTARATAPTQTAASRLLPTASGESERRRSRRYSTRC